MHRTYNPVLLQFEVMPAKALFKADFTNPIEDVCTILAIESSAIQDLSEEDSGKDIEISENSED